MGGRHKARVGGEAASGAVDSRALILDAAAELFSTFGYTGTGLRQIADHVGLRPASVYHHFDSKELILEEILRIGLSQTMQSTRQAVEVLPPEANPRDRIEAAIAGHLRGIHENVTYTSTNLRFHGQMPPEVAKRIQPMRQNYTAYWRNLLESAKRAGYLQPDLELSLLRALVLGALNRSVAWFDLRKGPLEPLIHATIVSFGGIWTKDRSMKLRFANGARNARPRKLVSALGADGVAELHAQRR